MSNLILPHWKTDWSALLMSTLKLTDNHLTHTATNHLAFCDDCLCNEEIVYPACSCISENYGTAKTIGAATVTVTGSMSMYNASSPFCVASGTCASLNGTYVRACTNALTTWTIASYVCTSGSTDYYYINQIEIVYQAEIPRVRVRIRSAKSNVPAGDPNPYPTLVTTEVFSVFGQVRTLDWSRSTGVHQTWRYALGGTCQEECNEVRDLRKCPTATGSVTWDTDTSGLTGTGPTNDHCELSGLTITANIAAAA